MRRNEGKKGTAIDQMEGGRARSGERGPLVMCGNRISRYRSRGCDLFHRPVSLLLQHGDGNSVTSFFCLPV